MYKGRKGEEEVLSSVHLKLDYCRQPNVQWISSCTIGNGSLTVVNRVMDSTYLRKELGEIALILRVL
jgi:hypothetical protein